MVTVTVNKCCNLCSLTLWPDWADEEANRRQLLKKQHTQRRVAWVCSALFDGAGPITTITEIKQFYCFQHMERIYIVSEDNLCRWPISGCKHLVGASSSCLFLLHTQTIHSCTYYPYSHQDKKKVLPVSKTDPCKVGFTTPSWILWLGPQHEKAMPNNKQSLKTSPTLYIYSILRFMLGITQYWAYIGELTPWSLSGFRRTTTAGKNWLNVFEDE